MNFCGDRLVSAFQATYVKVFDIFKGYFKSFVLLSHSPRVVTLVLKLHAHVTEGIPSAYANFRSNRLKIVITVEATLTAEPKNKQQSIIRFLTLTCFG